MKPLFTVNEMSMLLRLFTEEKTRILNTDMKASSKTMALVELLRLTEKCGFSDEAIMP